MVKTWLRMLVITLVFGMAVVGCDDGSTNGGGTDPALNGTWIPENVVIFTLVLNNGNFEYINPDGAPMNKGTYTVNNGKMVFITTHIHSKAIIFLGIDENNPDDKWYSKNELQQFLEADLTDHWIINWFGEKINDYILNGNKLTLIQGENVYAYNRK